MNQAPAHLEPRHSEAWRSDAGRAALWTAGVALLAVLCFFAYRFTQLRWYYAEVTLEGWTASPARPGHGVSADPRAQFLQIIRKAEILYSVIDALDLTHVYARQGVPVTKQEAHNILLDCLQIEGPSPVTGIARIGVFDHNPATAALYANTVASSYLKKREEDQRENLRRSLAQYSDEVELQKRRVPAASEEMKRIRERDQVVDPNPELAGAVVSGPVTGAYLAAKTEYHQTKLILENAEAALGAAQREKRVEPVVRIRKAASPPDQPISWWRGDPRE